MLFLDFFYSLQLAPQIFQSQFSYCALVMWSKYIHMISCNFHYCYIYPRILNVLLDKVCSSSIGCFVCRAVKVAVNISKLPCNRCTVIHGCKYLQFVWLLFSFVLWRSQFLNWRKENIVKNLQHTHDIILVPNEAHVSITHTAHSPLKWI